MTEPLLLSRLQIDDQRWDLLISTSEQQIVYAQSWYLDIICEHWEALVWPSADDYQVVMPIPTRYKWGLKVVEQPLFCQFLGFFSITTLKPALFGKFLSVFSNRFSYISSYNFHPVHFDMLKSVKGDFSMLRYEHRQTVLLSLDQPYVQIKTTYTADRLRNLRRGEEFAWQIKGSLDIEMLGNLFRDNHAGRIEGGVSRKAYEMLVRLFEALHARNQVTLMYALKNGQIHAGAMFVHGGKSIIYLFNAADETGRQANARTVLIDNYLKDQAEKTLEFDFESPEVKSIFDFYKSFGAVETPYIAIWKNELPFPFKQLQNWRLKRLVKTTAIRSEDF